MVRTHRLRLLALGAANALLVSLLVGIASTPAAAHPEVCDHDHDHEGEVSEICFADEEIAAMDDSVADLDVDQIDSSDNMRLVRARSAVEGRAHPRRLLVRVLVQRPDLLQRHPEGSRRGRDQRPAH